MTHQHLLVKRDDAITTITLNRPEKRNALALDVMVELTDALREVGDSDALGVILAANGPVFSAGHNFGDMRGADLSEARRLFQICTAMMDAVQEIPQPVVAKVHAAGHGGRLPARRLLRSRRRRGGGGVRHPGGQGRAVLPHPAGGGGPQHRSQAGPGDGLHGRRHRRAERRRTGA